MILLHFVRSLVPWRWLTAALLAAVVALASLPPGFTELPMLAMLAELI